MKRHDARRHLRPDEEVRWYAQPSRWGIVPELATSLVALLGTLGGFLLLRRVDPTEVGSLGVVAFALLGILGRFGQALVRILFTTYLATEERFYAVTSFFATTVQSVPLTRLSTVTVRQGLVQSLLGLWTARVTAYGEAGATLDVPAIRDGEGLLQEGQRMLRRGANVNQILRGD